MRVVLIDERALVRDALASLLDREHDVVVVACAATLAEAIAVEDAVDIVVTEYELPDAHGAGLVEELMQHFPDASIVVLSMVRQSRKVHEVMRAGAAGYALKTSTADELLDAMRDVMVGETYLHPSLVSEVAREAGLTARGSEARPSLNAREEAIVRCIALGYTNVQTAEALGLSLRTVETHRSRLMQKLGRRSRAELVAYAKQEGLLSDHE